MINVKVKDLEKMVRELLADDIDYVEFSILESEEFDGDIIPASLHFSAYDGTGGGVDYDGVQEIEVDPFYKL